MKNKESTFIPICGIIIICVFGVIIGYNLLPRNNESNSYYLKVEDGMSAKIEELKIENNKLYIKTSGEALKYCSKTTKSTPKENSLCWHEIDDNSASISIYPNKKYYVWIMDTNGNISKSMGITANNK